MCAGNINGIVKQLQYFRYLYYLYFWAIYASKDQEVDADLLFMALLTVTQILEDRSWLIWVCRIGSFCIYWIYVVYLFILSILKHSQRWIL